jgi:hypothetical protein
MNNTQMIFIADQVIALQIRAPTEVCDMMFKNNALITMLPAHVSAYIT